MFVARCFSSLFSAAFEEMTADNFNQPEVLADLALVDVDRSTAALIALLEQQKTALAREAETLSTLKETHRRLGVIIQTMENRNAH